ncbi:MAG: response regulator [Dehalococcoidales bacterium]|nr:response regulator [Dehalococcoidales bacterium]
MNTNKRVLVVDDEPGIVNILRIKLRISGYDVVTTTSGAEAIELVRADKFDVMLLDVLMPGVSGFDVLEKVRSFSRVPIIVFTAKPDIMQFAIKLGADNTIAKPFDPEEVVKKIEMVLDNARHEKGG